MNWWDNAPNLKKLKVAPKRERLAAAKSTPSQIPTDLVGTKEAAELIGVSPKTLINWISLKKINAFKVGRFWRFSRSDLKTVIQEFKAHG